MKQQDEFTFQDISEHLNRSLTSIQELMKNYNPVRITNTNKYYFSMEQVCIMTEELRCGIVNQPIKINYQKELIFQSKMNTYEK